MFFVLFAIRNLHKMFFIFCRNLVTFEDYYELKVKSRDVSQTEEQRTGLQDILYIRARIELARYMYM